jgi:DNA-binding CsgD family transcriptional regulator
LKELYGLREEKAIARELNRPVASVRRMADAIFKRASRSGPWTSREVQELRRYLGATTTQVIARILGRTEPEVQEQIIELGRMQKAGRWTPEEIVEFKRLYGTRTDDDIALIFGRSIESVKRLGARYCLAKDKAFVRRLTGSSATRMPRWNADEIEKLRELYPNQSNLEIAQRLGRSVKSIVSKAHNLGLKKDVDRLREMGRENVSLRYRRGSGPE